MIGGDTDRCLGSKYNWEGEGRETKVVKGLVWFAFTPTRVAPHSGPQPVDLPFGAPIRINHRRGNLNSASSSRTA